MTLIKLPVQVCREHRYYAPWAINFREHREARFASLFLPVKRNDIILRNWPAGKDRVSEPDIPDVHAFFINVVKT